MKSNPISKNLYPRFSEIRINRQISDSSSKAGKKIKEAKPLNEVLNESGNNLIQSNEIELQHWNLPPRFIEMYFISNDNIKDIKSRCKYSIIYKHTIYLLYII